MAFRTQEEEGALDTMSIDDYLIENKEATFMLRVNSDSMSEAGILRGDLVLIDRSKEPISHDIVIVVLDGVFKIGYRDSFHTEAKVEAVVVGVVRKYA